MTFKMSKVIVTGAEGQLGMCLRDIVSKYPELDFTFTTREDIDITCKDSVSKYFNQSAYDWCINCAAYTFVDKAEEEFYEATKVNVDGPRILSEAASRNNCKIIHISTDFVFDGKNQCPYTEDDKTKPLNVYGKSKLNGEYEVARNNPKHYIIRTSWLYSEHGNNFVKTILKLASNRLELSVINDQYGSPTYAKNLAEVIVQIIIRDNIEFGVYHYSNKGTASWFQLAKEIIKEKKLNTNVLPISETQYNTIAKRPKFSVLDTGKIAQALSLDIPSWKDSLKIALLKIT